MVVNLLIYTVPMVPIFGPAKNLTNFFWWDFSWGFVRKSVIKSKRRGKFMACTARVVYPTVTVVSRSSNADFTLSSSSVLLLSNVFDAFFIFDEQRAIVCGHGRAEVGVGLDGPARHAERSSDRCEGVAVRCAEERLESIERELVGLGEEVEDAATVVVGDHDRDPQAEPGDLPECGGIVECREVTGQDHNTAAI